MTSAFSVSQPSQVHLPRSAAGLSPTKTATEGQVIAASGSGAKIGFFGAGANGIQSGTLRITFTEGTIARAPLSFADWKPGRTVRFVTLPTDRDLDVFAMAMG